MVSACEWASLAGPVWLHSHIWYLGKDGWKAEGRLGIYFYLHLLCKAGSGFLTAWWLGFERQRSKKKHSESIYLRSPGTSCKVPYHLALEIPNISSPEMHFWCILLASQVTKASPCSRQTSSLNGRSIIKELVAIFIVEGMVRAKSRNKEEEEQLFFFQRMSHTVWMNYNVHGI